MEKDKLILEILLKLRYQNENLMEKNKCLGEQMNLQEQKIFYLESEIEKLKQNRMIKFIDITIVLIIIFIIGIELIILIGKLWQENT